MSDSDVKETGSQTSVLQRIKNITDPDIKITFQESFPDLPLSYPQPEALVVKIKANYKNPDPLLVAIRQIYDFVDAPIINYPGEPNDKNIDQVDKKIQALFEGGERTGAYKILQNNKMRVNLLVYPFAYIDLISGDLSDSNPGLSQQLAKIAKQLPDLGDYKEKSPEEKLRTVKINSKASEMALRLLDGQKLAESDWSLLTSLQ